MCRPDDAGLGGLDHAMRLTVVQSTWNARAGASLRAIAVCASLFGFVFGLSMPAHAQSLPDALGQAYRYNPQIDAERARLRATDEDVARANSGYRPSINATGDVTYDNTTTRTTLGRTTTDETAKGYAVQLVQPIFRGFRVVNAVNAAEASVRAGREQLRLVEQQVLLDAVTAYGNVVRDQAIVRLRESNLSFLSAELRATQDRFSVGEVTKTDVAQAEARRALGQSDLDLARANLKSSRAVYEQVIGSPPQKLSDPSPNSKLLPKSLDEAIAIGTQENPQVVGALYLEQAARFAVDQIRGELLPEAQIEASWQERFDQSTTLLESESATIVGRVNVPIYDAGGEVYARVRQAKHTHISRLQEIEQARALAQAQVAQAWSQLQGFRAKRVSDEAQIDANRTALEGVREEEKVGQRTLLDVLDAQRELLFSQVELERTKRDTVVAAYAVIAAVGRLNIAELGVTDAAYDPEVHYQEVRRKWWGLDITHDDGRREHIDASQPRIEVEPMKLK